MEKGGGKGNWSAYKAAEMAKVYEAKGGGYEDSGDNPNEASKVSCASERASERASPTQPLLPLLACLARRQVSKCVC